jgi:hypothetical protein
LEIKSLKNINQQYIEDIILILLLLKSSNFRNFKSDYLDSLKERNIDVLNFREVEKSWKELNEDGSIDDYFAIKSGSFKKQSSRYL